MEDKIISVINGLVDGIRNDIEKDYGEVIKELLSNPMLNWKNPDNINVLYFYETKKFIPALLRNIYPTMNYDQLQTISFIYEEYSFIYNSIHELVDMGVGCAADKTRWVIKQYLKMCLGGNPDEIPLPDDENHRFYHPDFGKTSEWIDYIKALYKMFYKGYSFDVSNTYSVLASQKTKVI